MDGQMEYFGRGFFVQKKIAAKLPGYQKHGLLWLFRLHGENTGAIIADDGGLGKTAQIVVFLSSLFAMDKIRSVIIVLPHHLFTDWMTELKKFNVRVQNFNDATKCKRLEILAKVKAEGGVILITYTVLAKNTLELNRDILWDYMIVDQGHNIKNHETKRTQAAKSLISVHRILLTEAPIKYTLLELWSLFDFTHKGGLLGSLESFKKEFQEPIQRAYQVKATANDKRFGNKVAIALREKIKEYFLRRTKSEHLRPDNKENEGGKNGKNDFDIWTFLASNVILNDRDYLSQNDLEKKKAERQKETDRQKEADPQKETDGQKKADRQKEADRKKEAGNCAYTKKDFKEALRLYSEAIGTSSQLHPTCAKYYYNRAACHKVLSQVNAALEDSRRSTRLDERFLQGYVLEAKCQLALGDGIAAERALLKSFQLDPGNPFSVFELNRVQTFISYMSEANNNFAKGDYRTCLQHVKGALQYASSSFTIKLLEAECLLYLARYDEANKIISDILRSDSTNVDAIYVRGLMLYYQDNVDKALDLFAQVLKWAPDHERARVVYKRVKRLKLKKEEGKEAFQRGLFQKAHGIYTEALGIDPINVSINAKLYLNRAIVSSKLNNHSEGINDATSAIQLDKGYVKAYFRRARCYMDMDMFEEAIRDYQLVCEMDKSTDNAAELLKSARLELMKSKRRNFYQILGIAQNSNASDIKNAYRNRAKVHHPDRHVNALASIKKSQEQKFKELNEAHRVLSDPVDKKKYDIKLQMDQWNSTGYRTDFAQEWSGDESS